MKSITYTVTDTAVKIVTAAANDTRQIYVSPSGNDLHIGGSDVTTANGLKVQNNTTIALEIPPLEELWAVVASGSHTVTVLRPSDHT